MDKGLDEDFKRIVAEMKPHAKKLPQKSSERHKVTLWIKKLLGVKYEKKERNAYARLLLQQLKCCKLEPPFTEDPPSGLLSMPTQTSSQPYIDQSNELDTLLTSVLSPSHHTPLLIPHSRGSPSHYRRTNSQDHVEDSSTNALPQYSEHRPSNLDSQRPFSYGDLTSQNGSKNHHKTKTSQSFEPRFHSSAEGATSLKHKRAPGRVHYSDTILYLGGQPGKTSPSRHGNSKVSSHGGHGHSIQTNLPNGIGSFSSNDFRHTHQPTTGSLNHGDHRSASTRHGDVMDGRSFSRGQEVVDDDVMMVGDLDVSTHSLSDELVGGGVSYGDVHMQEDGELSDISELLIMPPHVQPKPTSGRIRRSTHFTTSTPYHANLNSSAARLSRSPSHSPTKADISREILQAREVELKLRQAEARFEEEKLDIQKTQEESIKKLLDRKNNELEDMRSEHHLKVAQLESLNQRLERKLSQVERESSHLQEMRDKEVSDLRQAAQLLRQQLQADFDKKLNTTIAGFERDKLELEQYHTKQLHRIIKENSSRMAKMEEEHNTQNRNNVNYLIHKPEISYRQGMTDLLAPLLAALDDAAEAFWYFTKLVQSSIFYMPGKNHISVKHQLEPLCLLIQLLIPSFYAYLDSTEEGLTLMFCHRWLLVCLKREFPEEDALAIWEACWTNYETTSFHLFICIAIMAMYGQRAMDRNMNINELMVFFNTLSQSMPRDTVMSQARGYLHRFCQLAQVNCKLYPIMTKEFWERKGSPKLVCEECKGLVNCPRTGFVAKKGPVC